MKYIKTHKIAIIAHSCRAGGGLFATINLIRAMFEVARDEQFLLISSKGCGYESLPIPKGSELYVYKGSHSPAWRFYFEKVTLPKIINAYNPNVIFGPGNIALTKSRISQAVFIRNAYLYHGPERYPQTTLMFRLRTWALRNQVKRSLSHTQMVFAQTPIVKQHFSKKCHYPADQIKIIRFPVSAEIRPQGTCQVPEPLASHQNCIKFFMLTRFMPHRNPGILIPLCLKYKNIFQQKKIRFITTVGAHEKPLGIAFLDKIKKHNLQDIIINVGQLNRQEVIQYYTHCDVMWLHTLIETLCMPFLESMTMGVPILAPDFDFSRYVCGDAAIYYDPWDLDSLFVNIIRLTEQRDLLQQLINNGFKEINNTEKFSASWQEAAKDVLNSLRELTNQ